MTAHQKRPFVVFDIDGTLYRSSLFMDLMDALHTKGHFPAHTTKTYQEKYQQWRNREHKAAYDEFTHVALAHIDDLYSEITPQQVQELSNKIVEQNREQTYVYTTQLLKELRAKGYVTLAISGSNEELVKAFAQYHEFDAYSCSVWHTVDNGTRYSGEWFDGSGDKKVVLQGLMRKHNLTYEGSVAVGDTASDISMLEEVETAIAFNPSPELLTHARSNKWKIVVERKSVAYELTAQADGSYILA